MIGWVAVREQLEIQAWILGAILFVWQLPHFLSLAWLYKDQYADAGFRMLPVVRGGPNLTAEVTLLTTLLLIPLGLAAALSGMTGLFYAVSSIILGFVFTWFALVFFRRRDRKSARGTFLFSLLYLPLLLIAMIANRSEVNDQNMITVDLNPDASIQLTTTDE